MAKARLRLLRALGSGIRAAWLLLGLTLLLIIVCEAGLRLALTTRDRLMDRQPRTERTKDWHAYKVAQADTYRDAEWIQAYVEELSKTQQHPVWSPYVYWRQAPHRGRYITVNRNGLRATWNPPPRDAAAAPPPVRVFTFGGSTMWGWGARDDHTIASYLSKLLDKKGYRAAVTNYGQLNYVSTQEVIALLRCIQGSDVPDIVLFYDGINDISSSHQNGAAGLSGHEKSRREEFNLSRRPQKMVQAWGRRVLPEYFRGFQRLVTRLQRHVRPQTAPLPSDNEVTRHTVRVYRANLTLVESLGRSYGFDPLFYWQPIILSKRHRSPREQALFKSAFWTENKEIFATIYRRVRQSAALNSHPRFHNLSALFDAAQEPYYVDEWHLSETGNQRIAAAMVDDIIALIEQRRVAAAGQALR